MSFKSMIERLNDIKTGITALLLIGSLIGACFAGVRSYADRQEAEQESIRNSIDELKVLVLDLVESNEEQNEILDQMRYETEFKELKVTLDGLVTYEEILAEVDVWIAKRKGSKLASLSTLCEQPSHEYLEIIMLTELTANAACRKIGEI
jgi:hypothetical protein